MLYANKVGDIPNLQMEYSHQIRLYDVAPSSGFLSALREQYIHAFDGRVPGVSLNNHLLFGIRTRHVIT